MVKNNGRFIFMNKTVFAGEGGKNKDTGLVFCALRGLLTAVIAALALSAAAAALSLSMGDPAKYAKIFAFAALFLAAFYGGFSAAKRKGGATLLCGFLSGAFLLALIALSSLCLSLQMNISLFLFAAPCVLFCSLLGANLGVGAANGKKKTKHGKNRV